MHSDSLRDYHMRCLVSNEMLHVFHMIPNIVFKTHELLDLAVSLPSPITMQKCLNCLFKNHVRYY